MKDTEKSNKSAIKKKFDKEKFKDSVNIFRLYWWYKEFGLIIRVAVLGLFVFGSIYGIGYWRGLKNQPIRVDGDAGEERVIEVINGGGLTHTIEIKDGGKVYFDGELQKVKSLSKGKPYGFRLQPGIGLVDFKPSGFLNIAHFKKLNIDLFGNRDFVGGGVSYQIYLQKPFVLNNTYLGAGFGHDITKQNQRYVIFIKVNF